MAVPCSHATKNGHLEVTKLLLAQDNIEVKTTGWYGHSPLLNAAENGHLEVTKLVFS
jgi:ankyrin repeat protein